MLRLYVMGDDARRAATADEIAEMCAVLRQCLDAGAVGMSTSFVDIEDDLRPVPCRFAEHDELEALCAVLGEHGRMLQIVHEFFDADLTVTRVEMLGDLSRRHGIPTTLSPLFHSNAAPDSTDRVMAAVEREVGRRRPRVAAGADPADRHQLDARPAQHHVPGHPRLVEGAVAADQGGQARGAGRSGDAGRSSSPVSTRSARHAVPG